MNRTWDGFSKKLIEWWISNGRDYPWRHSTDPYQILVAEVLLHRTNADAVLANYPGFLKTFPKIESLAQAETDDLIREFKSLGLSWRFRSMTEMARQVADRYGGTVPLEKHILESLPGIGDYISSAVIVFSSNRKLALIDTNTVRIISRITGSTLKDSTRKTRWVRDVYLAMLGDEDPPKFGYAMIDLASSICRPRDPMCKECPVVEYCSTGGLRIIGGNHR